VVDPELYRDLKALSVNSFPKKCNTCGAEYADEMDFLAKTQQMPKHSGLKSAEEDDGSFVVEVFRNCVCGSTLMDEFADRRDMSEQGSKRRALFIKLHENLVQNFGIEPVQARNEILAAMRGDHSEVFESLGIHVR